MAAYDRNRVNTGYATNSNYLSGSYTTPYTGPYSQVMAMKKRYKRSFVKAELQVTIPAPPGCLQYFTAHNGVIESFNYGHYLNNLDYAICIERHASTVIVFVSSALR